MSDGAFVVRDEGGVVAQGFVGEEKQHSFTPALTFPVRWEPETFGAKRAEELKVRVTRVNAEGHRIGPARVRDTMRSENGAVRYLDLIGWFPADGLLASVPILFGVGDYCLEYAEKSNGDVRVHSLRVRVSPHEDTSKAEILQSW